MAKKYSYVGKSVKVKCIICRVEFDTAYNTYHHKPKSYEYKCPKCMKIHRANIINDRINNDPIQKKVLAEARKKFWKSLSEEDKAIRIQKWHGGRDNWYSSLTDDEKRAIIVNQSNKMKARYRNMSSEEKKVYAERASRWWNELSDEEKMVWSERTREQWRNMTQEEKDALIKKQRVWYHNLSDEEKSIRNRKQSEKMQEFWDNLSDDEKEKYSIRAKESYNGSGFSTWWKNLSDNELDEWILKRALAQSLANTIPKQSELSFMNDLDMYKISFQFQYTSQEKHPEFDNIFSFNPITNGRVVPYHNWDFCISLKRKKILIDIDGSIHNVLPGESIINGLDIGAYTQFNDSKRPYQTDGMDAYIIECYNNKLRNSSKVLNVSTGKYLTYEQFTTLLQSWNMSTKELKNEYKLL